MSEQERPGPGHGAEAGSPDTPGPVEEAGVRDARASAELRRRYEGQLAAKDAELGAQRELIAELRRRAEAAEAEQDRLRRARVVVAGERAEEARVAEAEREAQSGEIAALLARADEAEGFRDRMHDAAVRRYPHGPGTASAATPVFAAPREAGGLRARLRRWWRQG